MEPKSPLVFRLEPELHKRLGECAERTRLKKYTLALLAIEAAVDAIEKNDYQLVVPIQFEVAQVPAEKKSSRSRYPLKPDQGVIFNEGDKKRKAS